MATASAPCLLTRQNVNDCLRLASSEVLLSEQYIPARLLAGVLPTALLESHYFWQDQTDNLRGYPQDEAAPDQTVIYVTLQRLENVDGFNHPGVCGSVTKMVDGETLTLTSLLNAPQHSPLANLCTVLTRVESLSHVLVWCRPGPQHPVITLVRLPRLNLSFRERTCDGSRVLYSVDHANLFIPNFSYGSSQASPLHAPGNR